jgi:hypothetical protein
MQYSDFVSALAALLAQTQNIVNPALAAPSSIPDFNTILPRSIEFAELMMYRDPDLDFLAARTTDSTTVCTPSSRLLSLPAQIVVPISLNIVTPAGAGPDQGTRNNVEIVQKAFIDTFFATASSISTPSIPQYCALVAENNSSLIKTAVLGPAPDSAYTCEWFGIFRPAPLSATNTTTFLTLYLPDLFLSAAMIFWSGFQRNFGAQSDDPKMALSWRALYEDQKKGAAVEEARKKSQGPGWTAFAPTPVATPPRA